MAVSEFYDTMRLRAEALRRRKDLQPAPRYEFEPEVIEPEEPKPPVQPRELRRRRFQFPDSKDYLYDT